MIIRWVTLSMATLIWVTLAAAQQPVLIRGGNKILLKPSTKYLAIKLKPGIAPSVAVFTSAVSGHVIETISKNPILSSRGIVLLKTTKVEPTSSSSAHFTSAAESMGHAVPVYTLGGVDVVLTNEVIVKPKKTDDHDLLTKIASVGTVTPLLLGSYLVKVKQGMSALQVSNDLAVDKRTDYSEPNFITIIPPPPKVHAKVPGPAPLSTVSVFPSDQFFSREWSLANRGANGSKQGADIHAVQAWKNSDGSDTIIAILDEGVDVTHPDLKNKIVMPFDAITQVATAAAQQPKAWDGHGTACAGIAAATTNNTIGIAGVGYKASIMPIRIAQTDSAGGDWVTTTEIIARGINYAVQHGADVLSNSWGGGLDDPLIDDAVQNGILSGRKNHRGAVFVFASGNDGTAVQWPAKLAGTLPVIAVGASNEWDELKTFSSKDGENWWASNTGPEVTVVAPGVHILTTDITGTGGYVNGDYFEGFNGTSSATPHVAGIAALILSKEPLLKPAEVKARVEQTATPLGPRKLYGAGRVNACKAVHGSGC